MECSHGVISMGHRLEGSLNLNGKVLDFSGGIGYAETDRGRSFPDAYLWTQCVRRGERLSSLMLSVATIPLAWLKFTGCICAICCEGREYRLATYLGARVEMWSQHGAVIRQGKYCLEVDVPEADSQPLRAPVAGAMQRIVHESLCTKVSYRFWIDSRLVFEHMDDCASFEYAQNAV